MKLAYRLEIDGLRAIAVLLVFAFHLDISPLSGGFAGVDIFYVISGFVIFRSVLYEMEHGGFSVRAFYRRRARRILPALMVVILFSLCAGLFVLTPNGYANMVYTALAALFSVSNIYFFDHSGYFAASAKNIPLLHTWSLGVEEQFYLMVPLLFLVTRRSTGRARLQGILVGVVLLSFAYNLVEIYGLANDNNAFYLPMSRLWEIAVGGLVALNERFRPRESGPARLAGSTALAALGLLGIAASALFIDSATPFPGIAALLPVVSTALVILADVRPGSLSHRLLSARPMVFFGHISYSLYLFHWPLVVFAGLHFGRSLSAWEKGLVFLGAVLLSVLSWKYVEQPFRARRGDDAWSRTRNSLTVLGLGILVLCAFALGTRGFAGRMNADAREVARLLELDNADNKPCVPVPRLNVIPKAKVCSPYPVGERVDYILWGDSHAGMLAQGLGERMHASGKSGVVVTMADCAPLLGIYTSKRKNRAECARLADHIVDIVRDWHVPVVVLASRWANLASPVPSPGDGGLSKKLFDGENPGVGIDFHSALLRTVRRLSDLGAHVVVVGPVPEIAFEVPDMLIRASNWNLPLPVSPRADFDLRQSMVLEALEKIARVPGVTVVYPHAALCDAERCAVAEGLRALYVDDDHLSLLGTRRIVPAIADAVFSEFPTRERADPGK